MWNHHHFNYSCDRTEGTLSPSCFCSVKIVALIKAGTEALSTCAVLRLGHQSWEMTLGRIK